MADFTVRCDSTNSTSGKFYVPIGGILRLTVDFELKSNETFVDGTWYIADTCTILEQSPTHVVFRLDSPLPYNQFNYEFTYDVIVGYPERKERRGIAGIFFINVVDSDTTPYKSTVIKFPNDSELPDIIEGIESGSMRISKILYDKNINFGECNSSMFEANIFGIDDVTNKKIQVVPVIGDGEMTPLFTGVVDSCKKDKMGYNRNIIAYDDLYSIGSLDVTSWYNSFWSDKEKSTIKSIRTSLYNHVGLQFEDVTLPNDELEINKFENVEAITFLTALKYLGDINVCNPIIASDGTLKFLQVYNSTVKSSIIDKYEIGETQFEDFTTHLIDKVVIYDENGKIGGSYGSGDNAYIISGNPFLYSLVNFNYGELCAIILNKIKNITYRPANIKMIVSDVSLELGDLVSTEYGNCLVSSFELSGPQLIEQTIVSSGNEFLPSDDYNSTIAQIQQVQDVAESVKDIADSAQETANSAVDIATSAQDSVDDLENAVYGSVLEATAYDGWVISQSFQFTKLANYVMYGFPMEKDAIYKITAIHNEVLRFGASHSDTPVAGQSVIDGTTSTDKSFYQYVNTKGYEYGYVFGKTPSSSGAMFSIMEVTNSVIAEDVLQAQIDAEYAKVQAQLAEALSREVEIIAQQAQTTAIEARDISSKTDQHFRWVENDGAYVTSETPTAGQAPTQNFTKLASNGLSVNVSGLNRAFFGVDASNKPYSRIGSTESGNFTEVSDGATDITVNNINSFHVGVGDVYGEEQEIIKAPYYTMGTRSRLYPTEIGAYSVGIGLDNIVSGYGAFCTGFGNSASGAFSTIHGQNCEAEYGSFVIGFQNYGAGIGSFAGGNECSTSGQATFAFGQKSSANGLCSTAFGEGSNANGYSQFVIGKWNEEDEENKYALIIGNGVNPDYSAEEEGRSNALTVDWEGRVNGVKVENLNSNFVSVSGSKSVSSSTGYSKGLDLTDFFTSTGLWLVHISGHFPSNSTGRRMVWLADKSNYSSSVANSMYKDTNSIVSCAPVNGVMTRAHLTRFVEITSEVDLAKPWAIGVQQNSGSTLSVDFYAEAIKLNDL